LHDVEINGSGTIDGQGTNWWFPLASSRPNMINFSGCSNVLIQGVTLQNPPTFHIMVKGNNINLTIQGITENTPFDSHNTDGMDLASTNVLIRNCSISVGDDNIEIGGSGGAAANITVSNCVFGSGHGVSIGSLIATQLVSDVRGVHDLIVSNCSFNGTDNGIRMKTDRDRGGVCQNLKYLDITMTNVANPIIIYGYYDSIGTPTNITPFQASTDTVQTVTGSTPVWRNITISNLTASADSGHGVVGVLWGVPEMLISNVTFYNVHFSAPRTFCIYNAQAIRIIDSQIAAPSGTNTLTLYNADVTVTNSAANTNLVTLGGLASPPTNNTLAFFNAEAAVTDTNVLGAGPITLGGSTLTLNQGPVSFSNNINAISASTLVLCNGTTTMGGGLSGPGPLAVVVTNTGNLRFNQGVNPWGGTNAAFDAGASGVINNHSAGNIAILLGALSGGSGSSLRGSDQAGAGTDTYVVGSLNTNTTFAGTITNGVQHAVALVKIGSGTFAITGTNGYTGGTTLSNGTLAISNPSGQGTLTVAGGTNTVSSTLAAGDSAGTTGAVWVTGGRLDAGIQTIILGSSGVGQMSVSNGTVVAGDFGQLRPSTAAHAAR
jgi:autotransporter-associated beta strand protein